MTVLIASAAIDARHIIWSLLVAVIVGLIAYGICLIVNHSGGNLPANAIALLAALIAFLLYLLDVID